MKVEKEGSTTRYLIGLILILLLLLGVYYGFTVL
jgi:hypothetical protein